jgi:hypothetical protein
LRRSKSGAVLLGLLLVMLGIAPVLGRAPTAAPHRELQGGAPAAGMLLFIAPGPGGLPPNTLHRIYPDETGIAPVIFSQPLDVRRALIAPDGSRFALQVVEAGNIGRIYIGSANGASLTMVPIDATHMELEDWHPQGNELLIWHFTNAQYDLNRLTLDGQLTPLTSTPFVDERNGRWAPDGNRFSFTAAGLDGLADVFVQMIGGAAVNITQSTVAEGAAEWSPSGLRLVYEQNGNLVVSDPGGANSAPVNGAETLLAYGWTPGGEIYASDAEGEVLTAPDDGTALKGLLSLEANNWVSDWGRDWTAPLALLPEHVSIAVEQGAPNPAPVAVQVNSEDFVTPWSAASGASWLKVAPSRGSTPGTVELTFTTTNLEAGLYAAPVTFLPGPKTLNVTVAVNPAGAQSNLVVAPESLTFHGTVGGTSPAPASFSVTSSGAAVNWVASETAPWLSLSANGGVTPASVTASIDGGGLAAGRYETVITLQPGNRQVAVTLDMFNPAPSTQLAVTPDALAFTSTEGAPAPPAQVLSITSSGDNAAAWSAVTSAAWLQLSAYSGVTPSTVNVMVDPAGLPPGQYAGAVSIGQESVAVTLTVLDDGSPPPPTGNVVVSPGALHFAAIEGGAPPGVKDVQIDSASDRPSAWTASTSHPWLLLSAGSGTTPTTVKVRVEAASLPAGAHQGTVFIGDASIPVSVLIIESSASDPAFHDTWARQDLPIDEGLINRTWLWGPGDNGTTTEPYAEAPGGMRTVEYYDKSRMEVTYPDAQGEGWFVTNGLLATELITGQMQLGDNLFVQGDPAAIPVAGDADDVSGPRYASFTGVLDAAALAPGSVVEQTIDSAGVVSSDPALASYGVTAGAVDAQTGHSIASVFWSYLNSTGIIWNGASYVEGALFEPWFFATGLPITEPYWARVKVRGVVQDVLVQCFERRCLTYTPDNPAGWEVEQGNIGMHYFRWRYERPV